MRFEFKLAWRYFTSSRRNLVRFTTLVAIIGIAAGVASLIIAQAIAQGFRDEIQDKVLSNTAHILVSDIGDLKISSWKIIEKKIFEVEGVENVSPTSFESSLVLSDTNSRHAVVRVMDWKSEIGFEDGKEGGAIPVAVGKELANSLGLKIDAKLALVTFEGETPQKTSVIIGKTFETGLYEYDSSWIYLDEPDYLKLKGMKTFSPKAFSVSVKNIYQTDRISEKIQNGLGNSFRVIDWQESNKPLFSALSLERKVTLAIISLIIFIAALNITTTLALLVNDRRYDIGVLKTFGANTKSIVLMFLFEGIILSGLGIAFGVAAGLVACIAGNYLRLISLSKEVYSLNYVPFNVSLAGVLQISIIAFILCLLAIIYPAIRAGKIKPIENLKTH